MSLKMRKHFQTIFLNFSGVFVNLFSLSPFFRSIKAFFIIFHCVIFIIRKKEDCAIEQHSHFPYNTNANVICLLFGFQSVFNPTKVDRISNENEQQTDLTVSRKENELNFCGWLENVTTIDSRDIILMLMTFTSGKEKGQRTTTTTTK